jgi:glycosyltransferase involved in cell wall biosynthesis
MRPADTADRMRILLASSSSGSRGGGEGFLLYLGEALAAAGHTVALWAARHSRMDELADRFGGIGAVLRGEYRNTYDRWHRGLLPDGAGDAKLVADSWLAWKPDVIHLNKQNLEDGNDLLAALSSLPVPHLCTVHITQSAKFLGARFAFWRDLSARRALRSYRGQLTTTAPARTADLKALIGASRTVLTVLNGVPTLLDLPSNRDEIRVAEGLHPRSFAIVAVGRLEPQKCPLRFLHYAARIRAVLSDVQLRWLGGGRMAAEWDREVAARDLGNIVARSDWRNDVRHVLPAYDLFLHPAAYEGFSFAILEAMDAGLPCAIEQAVHDQLPPTLQACSLSISETTDWASLLRDRPRLADLGRRARKAIQADFSTQAMARAYERIYEELCGKR